MGLARSSPKPFMSNESNLVWAPLKKELDIRYADYQRFEDKLASGIPDVNICLYYTSQLTIEWWLELKYAAKAEEGKTFKPGLRKEQRVWLRRGMRKGRVCGVLCRVGKLWYLWTRATDVDFLYVGVDWSLISSVAKVFSSPQKLVDYLAGGRPDV